LGASHTVMAKRKMISNWRICQAEPSGLLLWFDPMIEFPRLFELEPSLRSGVDNSDERDDLARTVSKYQQLSLLDELPPDGDVE